MTIPIYPFGIKNPPYSEAGDLNQLTPTEQVARLGGKGAGLIWLEAQGLRVPPGFVIPTSVWAEYKSKPVTTMKAIAKSIKPYLVALKSQFGYAPLLSVRSGARVSCPGMMDTILNVGLDLSTSEFWAKTLGAACAEDSEHRLITMYGSVVKGLSKEILDGEIDAEAALLEYQNLTGGHFPDAEGQLLGAIEAVFKSWDNERAKIYRKEKGYEDSWGTACTVQAMVFGNLNAESGTGVLFTRNPNTGEKIVTAEFLTNAQGEDVVDGSVTPMPLSKMPEWNSAVYVELMETVAKIEKLKKTSQDIEFTIENGVLYFLQTRAAQLTSMAQVRIAMDMLDEGLLTLPEALDRIPAGVYDRAQLPIVGPDFNMIPHFIGQPACSGVVVGKPVFSAKAAMESTEPCILITEETNPDDIGGMYAAVGVITMKGGITSHAAVVARGMNKPCITGVGSALHEFNGTDVVSFDGATGRIWLAPVPVISGAGQPSIKKFESLVRSQVVCVPVIHDVPGQPLTEALLYVGQQAYETKFPELLAQILGLVQTLYLDFTVAETAEKTFDEMFLTGANQALLDKLSKIKFFDGRLVIIGEKLTSKYRTVVVASDLDSLVLAKGETVSALETLTPAVQKVLDWQKAEGLQFLSLGKVSDNFKSFVSFEQVLQGNL